MKKWTLLRDSLVYRDIFDKKKEKTDWANVVIAGVKAHENSVVQQKSDYITKIQASNNIGNEILSLVKNNISNIVQQYQIMYNSENEHNNTRLKNLLLENKNDLAVLMFLDIFPKEKNGALHSEIIKALYLQYPENLLVKERYQMENAPATSTAVGAIAPELAFSNPDGKILKLSDLRGKVVLVDFWASWCRPCRMENPHVTAMYQKYHDKGFEVYSVSLDRDKNSWVKAIADDKLVWPNHVSDLKYWSSEGAKIYGVSSIPATFLLDREGRIISKNLRGEALTKTLQEIFGE
ncbi:MAG: TlpA disulfide reductase family protein [Bacteroidales bacterium]